MYNISYFFAKVKYKLCHNNSEVISCHFRRLGMTIGKGSVITCNIMTPEPYLIRIGSNVTIANGVQFVTHDNSISKVIPGTTDLFGEIIIGDNCFIGAKSTILYGVEIANSVIIAAGSVVTKSIKEERVVVAGNPARIISHWDSFAEKSKKYAISVDGLIEPERERVIKKNLLKR